MNSSIVWQCFYEFGQWLYDWQTLTTGLIALIVGGFTIRYLHKQIHNQEIEQKKVENRKFAAARAVLPADLSSICEYAEKSADVTKMALQMVQKKINRAHLEAPSLPDSVIKNMQKFIENSDEKYADLVHEMLSCYQVQRARLRSMISDLNNPSTLNTVRISTTNNIEYTADATVELYLLATNMFEFARKIDDKVKIQDFTKQQVASAISQLDLRGYVSRQHLNDLERVLQKRRLRLR